MLQALKDSLDAYIQAGSILAVAVAFLIGVLVGFTPCVYPVLPITVATIGQVAKGKKLNGLFYSLVYVAGMAIVYCVVGVVTVLLGGQIGALWGNGWFLLAIGLVFLVVSLWMFHVLTLPVPQFIKGGSRRGGIAGTLGIGMASGLVVGPCTVPGLAVVLTLVAKAAETRSAGAFLFGAVIMLAYSIGLGSLVVLCGTFSGFLASLPRSGKWLNAVEKTFATLMLVVALFFVMSAGETGQLPTMADLLAFSASSPQPAPQPQPAPPKPGPAPDTSSQPLPAPTVDLPPLPAKYGRRGRAVARLDHEGLAGPRRVAVGLPRQKGRAAGLLRHMVCGVPTRRFPR